jgi:hypothetical protein
MKKHVKYHSYENSFLQAWIVETSVPDRDYFRILRGSGSKVRSAEMALKRRKLKVLNFDELIQNKNRKSILKFGEPTQPENKI